MEYIQLSQITKFYGSRKVLDKISFSVSQGQVVAVIGENGAGKSTLMNILGGLVTDYQGTMHVSGKSYSPQSAEDAFKRKIGFVHQHFLLAENLTALENLILTFSTSISVLGRLPKSEVREMAQKLAHHFGWSIPLDLPVHQLSIGDQQRIEILKSLLQDPDIIILDEPTAVLSPMEVERFLDFVLQLKLSGKTIFLITHKLLEVEKVADQVIVLRGGKLVHDSPLLKTNRLELAEKIIGHNLIENSISRKQEQSELLDITIPGTEIRLKKQEIMGLAGVEGNGQTSLIEDLLTLVKNKNITLADITEDRLKKGIFPGLNLEEHMVLRHQKAFSKFGFIQPKKAILATSNLIQQWDVRPKDSKADIMSFSGGNQQKFVVGKELWHDPDFILAAYPTRGLDLGAQAQIRRRLVEKRNQNKTIFLVSSDLEEILTVCDRYVIIYKNNIFGPFYSDELSEKEIGAYMTGANG